MKTSSRDFSDPPVTGVTSLVLVFFVLCIMIIWLIPDDWMTAWAMLWNNIQ
ncbi:hypothetical protein JXA80_01300 [bacterium]|nr:hypothetical protein [candidate division CSSED10-310 bacterium]